MGKDVTEHAKGTDKVDAQPVMLTAEEAQLCSQIMTGDETYDEDSGAHSGLVDKLDSIAAGE